MIDNQDNKYVIFTRFQCCPALKAKYSKHLILQMQKFTDNMSGRNKSKWWMPRHQKTMKDVAACDKLRRGGKQPLTRRFPNGETHLSKPQIL